MPAPIQRILDAAERTGALNRTQVATAKRLLESALPVDASAGLTVLMRHGLLTADQAQTLSLSISRAPAPAASAPTASTGVPADEQRTIATRRHPAPSARLAPPSLQPANADPANERTVTSARRPASASTPQRATVASLSPGGADPSEHIGRFELRHMLGRGGMGAVYRAFDPRSKREVALKLVRDAHPHPEALERFVDEACITAQLEHPSIIPVHDVDTDPHGRPFFVMKIVEGRSLRDMIAECRDAVKAGRAVPVPLTQRLDVILKICDAMAFAHSRGVIHRDLKPDNVMVGRFGEVQVMDWGLAKVLGARRTADPERTADDRDATVQSGRGELTLDSRVMGTPAYMAPEQARGDNDQVDARSDVYALGGLLYALLTFTAPRRGETNWSVVTQAALGNIERPSARLHAEYGAKAPRLSRELESICMKALAAKPAQRYATANAMRADVAAFLALEPISAHRAGPVERLTKWTRRHPTATLSAVFVLLLGLGGSVALAQVAQAEREKSDARRISAEALREKSDAALAKSETEAAARLERVKALAERGELDRLRAELGVKLKQQRDAVLEEFIGLYTDFKAKKLPEDRFWTDMPPERLAHFQHAFEAITRDSGTLKLALTAEDHFYLGVVFQHCPGRADAALEQFSRAIAVNAEFAPAYNNRGNLYRDRGDLANALEDFTRVIELEPGLASAFNNRGNVYRDRRLFAEAIADYTQALKIDPTLGAAYNNRGLCRMDLGDAAAASADFDLAIKAEPKLATAYSNRGMLKQNRGELAAAILDYTKALDIDPSLAVVYANRGAARLSMGMHGGALADFNAAISRNPNIAMAYCNRGIVYELTKHPDEARADFDAAIRVDSGYTLAYLRRGMNRLDRGDVAAALADFDAAIKLAPGMWNAWTFRGFALAKLGRTDDAAAAYDRALKLCPPENRAKLEAERKELTGK